MSAVAGAPVIVGRLGILAGNGRFPVLVAEAARNSGNDPFIFAIAGEADQDWSGFDHCAVGIGDLSSFSAIAQRQSIGTVVLAGGIQRRPPLRDIRPTWSSLLALPAVLGSLVSGGDDKLLRAVINLLERNGVHVLGAHQVAPGLLGQTGPLARIQPAAADLKDIAAAARAALALGRLDVGQGAVAVGGRVVALEGLEGTDAMLERVSGLRRDGRLPANRRGVLVKLCKPGQDKRADLPSIGPQTVMGAHAAGLAGIAIEAGRSLVLERETVEIEADRLGLFVTGIAPQAGEVS
jgi:DUF1009 family protein